MTSTATAAALTVRDPERPRPRATWSTAPSVLPQPLQVRAGTGAFAPLSATGRRSPLTSLPTPVGARPVTIDFKQSIAATESLVTGGYGKTLVFTLSATTP